VVWLCETSLQVTIAASTIDSIYYAQCAVYAIYASTHTSY